ncbi:MAG: hypothetical protein HYY22_00495 [Thaumarchaeota archaeon]|nr:hypothetical protein [Nitrososphaerota archaeon]
MDDLELAIIRRLFRRGNIGASHTSIEGVSRGLPKHMKGDSMKTVKRLIKDGWIVQHPTNYGTQIALNSQRIQEIRNLIR